jgi:hypothetical protein
VRGRWLACTVLVAAIVVCPDRADACYPTFTYVQPTNVELVARSPVIVVAKATAERDNPGGDLPRIELEVTRVIRGTGLAVGDTVAVDGSTKQYLGASKTKTDFSTARKGAYAGACVAYDYELGAHFLLLLEPDAAGWRTGRAPFTRVNEEVDPKGDAWTTAVTAYARIADLATAEARRRAIDELVAAGTAKGASAADKAIAADVVAHLAAPTPDKPLADLQSMYDTRTGEVRDHALISMAVRGDAEARPLFAGLVTELAAGKTAVKSNIAQLAIAAYYEQVADRDAFAALAIYYAGLPSDDRTLLSQLMVQRAEDADRELMERALAGANDREATRLATWFLDHPSTAATAEVVKRIGGAYGQHHELARTLAGMGDKHVIKWAKATVAAKTNTGYDRAVAIDAIAVSPRKDADALARKIIKAGGDDLRTLINGYGYARHGRVEARLEQIGAKRGLSAEARRSLSHTRDFRKANRSP